ncbi:MAG: HEAT repeat domain-containing protein [Candidatus Krumholzibacteria bacterium]|nr:HEAT repeat domain-containing protein [Candidatus Krumholzibacteria bacterium]MDH4337889.1 HEAT repeat domain-containing protein [Candidatus Krumholzibacteria bacterium]MDH5270226.1 HEAT repeat domain-containing protein [Candidatus Krumholzibacteria bacterium]
MKDTSTKAGRESATQPENAAIVEQVLKALTKLVNGRKIYAENNPRLEQFRNEFDAALRKFFEVDEALVLTIDQYTMRWNDHVVYENTGREESLAYILFRDGIGEVTIFPQAIGDEVRLLIDILTSELHSRDADEDVVTRFWTANFEHITYRVMDDYLADEYGAGSSQSQEEARNDETSDHPELLPSLEDKGRVIIQQADALYPIDTFLRRTLAAHHPEGDDSQREALYQRLLRTSFAVAGEEVAIYTRELEAEKAEDGVAAFAEAIFVFTLLGESETAVRDVMGIIDRTMEYAINEKQPATLARLTEFVREFEVRPDLPAGVSDFCNKLMRKLADPEVLAALFDRIDRPGPYMEATLRYAKSIGRDAVEPLTRVLHRIEGVQAHRLICDALMQIAGDDGGAVMSGALDRFDTEHPAVALDAVYIARAMNLSLTPRLRELVFYPETRVKLEMIDWISKRDGDDATDLLLSSLADLDKRIRLKVLEALNDRNVPGVREKLSDLAFGKDFNERAADEQEAFFRTLGTVGDIHTVDQIRAMIERRRRIGGGKGADVKLLAIRALERIKHQTALDVLGRLVEDSNEAVRLRAARASETLATALAAGEPRAEERRKSETEAGVTQ